MGKYIKTNRKNSGRRKTYFKKGHKYIAPNIDSYTCSGTLSSETVVTRPKMKEFTDAVKIQSDTNWDHNSDILPTKLRPEKDNKDVNDYEFMLDGSDENIIVNFYRLTFLITAFLPHSCNNPSPELFIFNRQGVCISVKVKCSHCSFISEGVDLFKTHKPARGPSAGILNTCLLIPVLKTKVGLSDIMFILSCMNIRPPCRSGLQRKLNRLADRVIDLGQQTMVDNMHYVKKVLDLAGQENYVDTEVDSSYNNRPQAGYEAATQSFSPLIEQVTNSKLPISVETANTLCSKVKSCEHNTNNCKKNFSNHESISSSETKHVLNHMEKVNSMGIIKVRSVTSDACAQTEKSLREYSQKNNVSIRHFKCFIHKLRTFQKHIRYLKLTSNLIGCNKDIYMRKLSTCLRARIRVELMRIKKTCKSENAFIDQAKKAIDNIVSCFGNDHTACKQQSRVCTAHLTSYNSSHLPYGKHLEINQCDIKRIQAVINKDFSKFELHKVCRLKSTNQCESLHHKVFTFAPKSTIYTRNFTGLCHSAVHSASLGNGKAAIMLARAIGIKYKRFDPFVQHMLKLDEINKYDSARKKSYSYKMARYISKLKKSNRPLMQNSLYKTNDENLQEEHGYALKTDYFTC